MRGQGQSELDVIGLNMTTQTAYLCEVSTHIEQLLYGSSAADTVSKVRAKYAKQQEYAEKHLWPFPNRRFMLWAPAASEGLLAQLRDIGDLVLVVNRDSSRMDELRQLAKATTKDTGNPCFRALQMLEHLRR